MDLHTHRLRAFLMVADEGSFTRAARRLHVAQQALSALVRRLEDELGVRLFERTTRAVELTAAGALLAARARRTLDELEQAVAEARRLGRAEAGRLTLGVMAGAALELTPLILEAFERAAPTAQLSLEHHLFDDPTAGLREGSADVAVVRPPFDARGLELRVLFSEPRWALVSRRHALGRARSVTRAALADERIVRPGSPDPAWSEFWAGGPGLGQPVDVRTLEESLELVSAGRAVSIVAAGWTRFYPHPGARPLRVRGLEPSQVAVAWRKGERNRWVALFVRAAQEVVSARADVVRRIERPRLGGR